MGSALDGLPCTGVFDINQFGDDYLGVTAQSQYMREKSAPRKKPMHGREKTVGPMGLAVVASVCRAGVKHLGGLLFDAKEFIHGTGFCSELSARQNLKLHLPISRRVLPPIANGWLLYGERPRNGGLGAVISGNFVSGHVASIAATMTVAAVFS
jgi:hypothetical protein